ncbi:hypothetical protein HY256_01740 [Candidatus Sumerlaeota bacterium]|nr:hypothetical protein [Candidatus Sumerlaeota bacterium]
MDVCPIHDGWPSMCRPLLIVSIMALALTAHAADLDYPRRVAQWHEVAVPSEKDEGARRAWRYAANYSKHEWRVYVERGEICAQLTSAAPEVPRERPKFIPSADQFRDPTSFASVEDGWLVGFNKGEFGAALYWFSRDGKSNYKISDHQVVEFFPLSDGIYAIEGLAHLSLSEGSIIRISRPKPKAHWQAHTVNKLPFAPYAISVRRDDTMLITLSDSLVSVGPDHKITALLRNATWDNLVPNSSVLSPDQQRLYIGMRQFVGEFDIPAKKLRLLIPSDGFLNKLPQEDEQRIRKQYSD